MALALATSTRRPASHAISNLNGMSPEAEIRSLYSLAPENVRQLPTLFAESVVESCSTIVGASSGEALVRSIGDERLRSPEITFRRIDMVLGGGSQELKKAIKLRFRSKVHRLYRISMSLEAKGLG